MSSNYIIVQYNDDLARQPNPLDLLIKYFSDPFVTGGGQIDHKRTNLNKKKNEAFINFIEPDVAKRVADRKRITIGVLTFDVELGKARTLIRRPILIDGNNVGIE